MAFDPDYVRLKATATVQLLKVSATNIALSTAASYRRIAASVQSQAINPVTSYVALSSATVTAVVIKLQGISGKFMEFLRVNELVSSAEKLVFDVSKQIADSAQILEILGIFLDRPASDSTTATDATEIRVEKIPYETVASADGTTRDTGKRLSDTGNMSDNLARTAQFYRSYTDRPVLADSAAKAVGKRTSDTAAAAELISKGLNKPVSDTPNTSEMLAKSFSKTLSDLLNLTDSVQSVKYAGVSSSDSGALSDFTAKLVGKQATDTAVVADAAVRLVGKGFVDSPTLNAVGYIRGQDYCDFTYFAEDYVGYSQTF